MLAVVGLIVAAGLVVAVVAAGFARLVWHLAGRPLALALGRVEPTADDDVVRGWRAERGGRPADALAAYDAARRRGRWDDEVEERRADLLRRCPALAGDAERATLEWLAALDPAEVLDRLAAEPTARKLRLVAAACCRRAWPLPPDDRLRAAVEAVERRADLPPPAEEALAIDTAVLEAIGAADGGESDATGGVRAAVALALVLWTDARYGAAEVLRLTADAVGRGEQVRLLGCVFGLPGRTGAADPAWRTDTVLAVARAVYDGRDFAALPILADALQDAGCAAADVLAHLRGPGPHCRGCWVVDMVLGKG